MVLEVFIYALLTALATGLGALPFAFVKKFSKRWLGFANAVAAGLMLAASFSLIYEGLPLSPVRTLLGVLVGLVFILVSHHWIETRSGFEWGQMTKVDAKKALMIVLVMTAHSFAEGVGVGSRSGPARPSAPSSRWPSRCTTSPRGSRSAWFSCPAGSPGSRRRFGASSRACPSP